MGKVDQTLQGVHGLEELDGHPIGLASTDGVTDAIMEQAKVAVGQLQAIRKGGSRHGKSKKP